MRTDKAKRNTLLRKQEIIYFLQVDVAVLFSLYLPLRQARFTHKIPHTLYGQINIFDWVFKYSAKIKYPCQYTDST